MHSINTVDMYDLNPPIQPVSTEDKETLMQKASAFQKAWERFNEKPFFSQPFYFILSLKWLERWKLYVSYDEVISSKNLNKFFGCGEIPIINEDIVKKNYKPDITFNEQLSHYNVCLNPDLSEGKDYMFIDENMWNILREDDSYEVKRYVEQTPEGQKVQLYYQKVTIIPLFNQFLKDIEKDIQSKLLSFTFQYSHHKTVEQFSTLTKPLITRKLDFDYKHIISTTDDPKLWIAPENTQKNVLLNILETGCKANSTFSYKIYIDATYIDPTAKLSSIDILDDTLLIMQMKQVRGDWCLFSKNHSIMSTCNSCRNLGELKYMCSCKYALYCSLSCKNKDKYYHKYRCPNDAESDEQQQELVMNQQSKVGVVGLRNLGNTCFMNSGIQCLSHIPQLTEYFLSNQYLNDINKENPLGTKGQLSLSYGKTIKQLWFGKDPSISPTQLKRAIGKYQPMFSGYNQHDSGQLITYLLDGLHEDLNRIKKKPYVETKDYDGRPDKVIAREQWQQFMLRNKSKLVQTMFGQYRSVLDCPKCNYRSIQFDPFMMCSLPLVNNSLKKIQLTYLSNHVLCEKIQISFEKEGGWKVRDLLNEVKKKIQKPNVKLIAYVASYSSCDLIDESRSANDVRSEYKYRRIFVRELEEGENPDEDLKIILSNTVCHHYYKDQSYRKSLVPYRLYFFKPDTNLKQLHHKLCSYYKDIKQINNYEDEVINVDKNEQPVRLLSIPFSKYSPCEYCGKKNCEGCPIPYDENTLLKVYTDEVAENKPQFQLYWRHDDKNVQLLFDKYSQGKGKEEDDGTSKIKKGDTNLYDCLKLFSQPETLAEDNEWYCPNCKNFVLAKKQMHIYTAPKILILCLKRFKRKGYFQQKYNIFVDFPLQGLDLTEYVISCDLPDSNSEANAEGKHILYDLFGISNHSGGTGGGHYTAYCKNPKTGKWYDFDDSFVQQVSSQRVVSEQAYILFYRRRDV